ncbi:MAG: hypothetical protein WA902_13005 [Thermosynechococcaceae cyanobacterium]
MTRFWAYLISLFFGYALAGWVLVAYAAPSFVWIMTLALTVHLARVGRDAIALSLTWMVSLLWGAAYIGANPQHLQWTSGHIWGLSLLVLWLFSLLLVLLLAFARQHLPRRNRTTPLLVKIVWSSLAIGAFVYQWGGLAWIR